MGEKIDEKKLEEITAMVTESLNEISTITDQKIAQMRAEVAELLGGISAVAIKLDALHARSASRETFEDRIRFIEYKMGL